MRCLIWRSLADSNRCARFCRPVTKPLIQATVSVLATAKLVLFCELCKIFAVFFQKNDKKVIKGLLLSNYLVSLPCKRTIKHKSLC